MLSLLLEVQLEVFALQVPRYCPAGSYLKNVEFAICDPVGTVDETIHGHHHALTITSESSIIDDAVQYTFKNGRCIVPAIPVPLRHGTFRFLASHTQYPELRIESEVLTDLCLFKLFHC